MRSLEVIADDVTGACDVGAELAAAGFAVRVAVDGDPGEEDADTVRVVNTQSRAIRASDAYARVLRVARRRSVDLLLKKIDTALRGHLGAELDAAIDGLGAAAAFVVPAIPAAGRVTRDGCQWFSGRRLADTEFATDPEGHGAESAVAAVVGRESRRRVEVIALSTVRAGMLPERARTLMRAGVEVFVVDAETDDDLAAAATGILELPRPLCIAGSIGIAAAVAAAVRGAEPRVLSLAAFPAPALIVCGSLHSTARLQLDRVCGAGHAERLPMRETRGDADHDAATRAIVERARAVLASGRSVVVAAPPANGALDPGDRRAVERTLAEITRDVLRGHTMAATLVLIGGETSHAIFRALGTTELAVDGRVAPLVAVGVITRGGGAGMRVVVKGGSGGDPDILRVLLEEACPPRLAAV